jgi:hypothetical protein
MCISAALEQHARPYFPSVGRKLRTFFLRAGRQIQALSCSFSPHQLTFYLLCRFAHVVVDDEVMTLLKT